MKSYSISTCAAVVLTLAAISMVPYPGWAHCDSLEGPVVQDARIALEQGDPTPVLKWVNQAHEDEIRDVFKQTMAVRTKGDDAKHLADRYFFETLVRLHRAGEGEAFTGLRPASSVDPGIAAADKALQAGSVKELAKDLSAALSEGIQQRFAVALERQKHAATSVEAGREYVEAYVDYIHFVESANRLVSEGVSHQHHKPIPYAEH
ncbi:MAG TPA: DUF6448 family protein [Candidatus Competibacteraceae bacterium]|nr:DUF6448 family protein [Candidatus Competibacteraceae bacterium]